MNGTSLAYLVDCPLQQQCHDDNTVNIVMAVPVPVTIVNIDCTVLLMCYRYTNTGASWWGEQGHIPQCTLCCCQRHWGQGINFE